MVNLNLKPQPATLQRSFAYETETMLTKRLNCWLITIYRVLKIYQRNVRVDHIFIYINVINIWVKKTLKRTVSNSFSLRKLKILLGFTHIRNKTTAMDKKKILVH